MVFSPLLLIDVADIPGIGSGAAAAGGLWEWTGLSVLALTLSTTLLCLIYLWGVLFRDSNLQAYFKTELMELFITGVIFVLIYSLLGAFSVIKVSTFLPSSFLPAGLNPDTSIWIALGGGLQMMLTDIGQLLIFSYVLYIALDQMLLIISIFLFSFFCLSIHFFVGFFFSF